MRPRLAALLTLAATLAAAPAATADELLYDQPWTSTFAAPTSATTTSPASDLEVADDFNLVGTIGRVYAVGNNCLSCGSPAVSGVWVRFWEWTPSGPGTLQQETFVPAGDPNLVYDPTAPALLDVTLPTPFTATGQHFLSVQVAFETWGIWGWWLSNHTSPSGSPLLVRDASAGNGWGPFVDVLGNPLMADVAFQLWSGDTTPPDPGIDPCGDWVVVDSPEPPVFRDVDPSDVVVVGPDDAWMLGSYTMDVPGAIDEFTFAMHWDGIDWTIVPSPSPALFPGPGGTDAWLNAADAVASDDVWAAGGFRTTNLAGFAGTQILVLHWDGSTWQQVPAPNSQVGSGNYVSAVEAVGPDDVWFVGDWLAADPGGGAPAKAALAMHWDGSSFTVHETPYPNPSAAGYGLFDIDAIAPDDIWAVGGGHDGDMLGLTTYIVHWDGTSWTHVPAPTKGMLNTLYSVMALATDDVWVSGSWFDGVQGHPWLLHWDGSGWSEADEIVAGAVLHAVAPDEWYAINGKRIFKNDGAGWSEVMDWLSLPGVATGSIDSAGGDCNTLWVGGGETIVGKTHTFTARLVPSGPFKDLGNALAGSYGPPTLDGSGDPSPGGVVAIAVQGALENAAAGLVIGTSAANLPFKGGVLVPSPDLLLAGFVTDGSGMLDLAGPWPAGVPSGATVVLQAWVQDPAAIAGWAASNGLQVTGG